MLRDIKKKWAKHIEKLEEEHMEVLHNLSTKEMEKQSQNFLRFINYREYEYGEESCSSEEEKVDASAMVTAQ